MRGVGMKKTIICNIPMKQNVDLSVYSSNDDSIPVSDREVRYPINALLEKTLQKNDEIKVILLVKEDEQKHYLKNQNDFIDELNQANADTGAKIEIVSINTAFSEERQVHEELMGKIVDEIEDDYYITIKHEMSKSHYISFAAYVSYDRVLIIKLYPEQNAELRFPKMHGGKLYIYCNQHGLWMKGK
jgi:hypothetical protein